MRPSKPDRAAFKASDKLLLQNKGWAQQATGRDPNFFGRLANSQSPKFFWIGCADSRVAADTITGTDPGQMFVHRNIANVVVHSDLNLLSVLTYAVNVLKVDHVIVCGHHGCGGVRAAMTNKDFGMLNEWLRYIKDVYVANDAEMASITDPQAREDRLCELNAIAQLEKLAKTSIVQKAWRDRGGPWLHAWVYDLGDGVLHELSTIAPNSEIAGPHRFDFDAG
jgi:carbonic anhydrase